jgi:hypothetical protein
MPDGQAIVKLLCRKIAWENKHERKGIGHRARSTTKLIENCSRFVL